MSRGDDTEEEDAELFLVDCAWRRDCCCRFCFRRADRCGLVPKPPRRENDGAREVGALVGRCLLCGSRDENLESSQEGGAGCTLSKCALRECSGGGQQVRHETGRTWVQRMDVGPWTSQKCAREI